MSHDILSGLTFTSCTIPTSHVDLTTSEHSRLPLDQNPHLSLCYLIASASSSITSPHPPHHHHSPSSSITFLPEPSLTHPHRRQRRQRPRQRWRQAPPQDPARQHPGHHQTRHPPSGPPWRRQAYLCQYVTFLPHHHYLALSLLCLQSFRADNTLQ